MKLPSRADPSLLAAKTDSLATWSTPASRQRPSDGATPAQALGELAQAQIRCVLNLVLMALTLLAYSAQSTLQLVTVWYTFLFTSLSALALWSWAKLLPNQSTVDGWRLGQRVASIILDNLCISWVLYFGGQILAGVYVIYLWITIGYGIRYGTTYLYGNLAVSLACFITVASLSPFLRSLPALSIGLGFGLIVVPLYSGFLIKRLYAAVAHAEAATRAKGDFLAKMSHELRTPLHGVIALSELFSAEMSEVQRSEMVRLIANSANTLLDLINRVLDLSKYESGTFALQHEPMDLHQVVAQTLDILLPQASLKRLVLSVFVDATVKNRLVGSPRQLQEVIINLAGNSIKFTDSGSVRIAIIKKSSKLNDDTFVLSISDTGPGMTQEYLARVFDPFSQSDDTATRQHGGSGLGTTIARDLIKLMRGRIAIKTAPGVGTRIDIELALELQTSLDRVPLDAPELIVLVGLGATADRFRQQLSEEGLCAVTEYGIGELHRNLHLVPPRTCFFLHYSIADTVVALLREDLHRQGRLAAPVVIGMGEDGDRPAAIASGLLSYLAPDCTRADLRRVLDLASNLMPPNDWAPPAVVRAETASLILVAEDSATNQVIARMALERAGYRCHIVSDGERALDELKTGAYDLAIIDMHMPSMDGMEVAKLYNFGAFSDPRRTPIIMVTADNRPDLVADADLAGVARFAIKPLRPSLLIQIVQDILLQRQAHELEDAGTDAAVKPAREEELAPEMDDVIFQELLSYMSVPEAREFFAEFGEDAEGYIQTVRNAMEGGIGEGRVREEMHALCGSARTIGAFRLAAIARRVEYAEGPAKHFDRRNFADDLMTELRAVQQTVEQRLVVALNAPLS
ncbi:MAG: response regulator [Gammaproteobacteria bacterium]|nr:response regulator [Gammaproteobacteria bacterium]